jgi:hypothetical protein
MLAGWFASGSSSVEAIARRLGADVADPLFDGRALQLGYD